MKLKIPASTSNIGPGFDTLGLALKIYNEIEIFGTAKKFLIEYKNPVNINSNSDLFLKSYRIASQEIGAKIKNFHARIENNIPVGAGLGSSGCAVIGGVLTAFLLAGKKIDLTAILNIAIRIEKHPDNITPSLIGGFTVSSVVDNRVYFKKIPVNTEIKAVVVTPDFILNTKRAREVLPGKIQFKDAVLNLNRTAYLVSSFIDGELRNIQWAFDDRLHQPARSRFVPGLNEVIEKAHKAGAVGCFLSGAGPSVVALCFNNAEKIGDLIVNIWQKHKIKSKFIVTGIDNKGVKVIR